MNFFLRTLTGIFLLSIATSLYAGEVIIYGGTQKPGGLSWSNVLPGGSSANNVDLEGDFGSTFGFRYSAGRVVGFEQGIGFSPRFAKPGVKAFQADTNLIIQAPGNIVPYGTVGLGVVSLWGQEFPDSLDPEKIAAFVFSAGSNFAVNYGGGLKIRRIAGPLGINVDVRGYKLPGFETRYDEIGTQKGLNFVQITAGLVFTW